MNTGALILSTQVVWQYNVNRPGPHPTNNERAFRLRVPFRAAMAATATLLLLLDMETAGLICPGIRGYLHARS